MLISIGRRRLPLEDHLGSVGDSITVSSPPATQMRLYTSLQNDTKGQMNTLYRRYGWWGRFEYRIENLHIQKKLKAKLGKFTKENGTSGEREDQGRIKHAG